MSTFCTGLYLKDERGGNCVDRCCRQVQRSPSGRPGSKLPSRIVPQPELGWCLASTQPEPPSATLDVLLNDHAAVSEERAGQRLQERPSVGARVKRLHVAKGGTFAAHDASRGVDLSVQDDGAARTGRWS